MSTSLDGPKRTTSPYRSTPPPPSSTCQNDNDLQNRNRSNTSSPFYPGFLGSTEYNDEFNYRNRIGSSSSSSSRSASPNSPNLPYLVDSPQATSSSSSSARHSSTSKSQHNKIPHYQNSRTHTAFPIRSKSTPLGLEIGKGLKTPGSKKRPVPLNLGKARETFGVDEEMVVQRDDSMQRPLTASSVMSDGANSLTNELQDLTILRKTIRQNLKARPLDSPLPASDSEKDSTGFQTPELGYSQQEALSVSEGRSISIDETLEMLHTSSQMLVIDTRPLGSFLDSHLPRSANISIPSLIFKRLRKSPSGQNTGWDSLGGFISTQAGRFTWDELETDKHMNVVIVGSTTTDELAKVLYGVMRNLVTRGNVKILRGGWGSILGSSNAQDILVSGEDSIADKSSSSTYLPPPRSAPTHDISPVPPPAPPSIPPKGDNNRPPMPSLRPDQKDNKRSLPSLSINGSSGANPMNGPATSRRTPKLSLNLDRPLKSATVGSFNLDQPPPTPGAGFSGPRSGLLSVTTNSDSFSKSPRSPAFTLNIPRTPLGGSFHTLCHAQSKLPPSPSSFGDVKRIGNADDITSLPKTPLPGSSFTSSNENRPNGHPAMFDNEDSEDSIALSTAKNGIAPFIISTILPSFLYLGPEISSEDDVNHLKQLGVKRILNVALECNDDSGLRLKDDFKYHRIPMRDIVEESGVAKGMREACGFLDDARLHSAPTYVHCKAGKSRSVTVVLAYLIHANAWTLKTSYAYVAERRKGISPNIGFVAELMQFEEIELGLKQSGGVHGESSSSGSSNPHPSRRSNGLEESSDSEKESGVGGSEKEKRNKNNRTRESLPPTWSHSLNVTSNRPSPLSSSQAGERDKRENEEDDSDRQRRQVGDEREVRKNGQWVHHRRAPVDRTTLQPGRRVSKAGLESLRPLNTTSITPTNNSRPSPGLGGELKDKQIKHSVTPAGDGPLKWV
ncbi:uncharacterized protein I206_103304 [Kwoniella pini CBS 10737]|uniref:protein-tyrosine-phosphatase n=1 Tax=Kwoniella pini CBS 10737 TaxID=1296096 RepID=A0A1B9IAF2_9TREE|nr:uncharacterized protein I206_01690 [Kwoniella pini CBS 10737]OCF52401.1 hypothetical protein I206_01690 [Kwoniella pini CBS 10737]